MTEGSGAVVSVRRWPEFTALEGVLDACLADVSGLEAIVRPGQTVVIKPNLTADAPASSGGTTHVELVEALVRRAQRYGAGRVVLAEGTGAFGDRLETAFLHGGWREMAAHTGAEIYNLDAGPHLEVALADRRYPGALPFSRLALEADVLISVPCLKTHISTDYTVALKNSFCMVPQWKRSEIHAQHLLEEALVDINRIRRADLVVVDGWDGAEGVAGGEAFTRPAGARVMLVGADPVAVDVVSRQVIAQHLWTRYLAWAAEDGVGVGDPNAITVRGDGLAVCRHPFASPVDELHETMPWLHIHDRGACSGCRCLVTGALWRFRRQRSRGLLSVVFGPEAGSERLEGHVFAAGDCARGCAAADTFVAGCPPPAEAIIRALEETGCVCRRCATLARGIVAELQPEVLAHLRVSASGAPVHVGAEVQRDAWHLELLVGDCMARYAHVNRERARQFGLDPEQDIAWVAGCPAQVGEVREAAERLGTRLAGRVAGR